MTAARKRARKKLGRQDRWPSDYGVRDEQDGRAPDGAGQDPRSWAPGEKGQGREGRNKGYGGSGGDGSGPSGPETPAAERRSRNSVRRR